MGFNSKLAKLEKDRDGAGIRADSDRATESRLSGVAAQPASRTNATLISNFIDVSLVLDRPPRHRCTPGLAHARGDT
jgi:hypothetical protein